MIQDWFLQLVRCPIDYSKLSLADDELLRQTNQAIEDGQVVNRSGQVVEQRLDAALVNEGRSFLFPIVDGIPNLIADEAVALPAAERRA